MPEGSDLYNHYPLKYKSPKLMSPLGVGPEGVNGRLWLCMEFEL